MWVEMVWGKIWAYWNVGEGGSGRMVDVWVDIENAMVMVSTKQSAYTSVQHAPPVEGLEKVKDRKYQDSPQRQCDKD